MIFRRSESHEIIYHKCTEMQVYIIYKNKKAAGSSGSLQFFCKVTFYC